MGPTTRGRLDRPIRALISATFQRLPYALTAALATLAGLVTLVVGLGSLPPLYASLLNASLRDAEIWTHLGLSLWVAGASTVLSVAICNAVLARSIRVPTSRAHRVTRYLGAALATPHLAVALALGWLVAPTGLIWRFSAQIFDWPTQPLDISFTNDAWGLSMVVVLVLKEVPFLLWVGHAEWQRHDQFQTWHLQWQTVQTWGYTPWQAWRLAVEPGLWLRLRWPVLAVWAYGIGVVDVGMAIGPTTTPTGAVLAWQWLTDPNPVRQEAGVALSGLLALCVLIGAWCIFQWLGRRTRLAQRSTWRSRRHDASSWLWHKGVDWLSAAVATLYVVLLALILCLSWVQWWPYPSLWPQHWSADAWSSVISSAIAIQHTLSLAVVSTLTSLLLLVIWLEVSPPQWQKYAQHWAMAWLLCPPLLWLWSMHGLAIYLGIDGTWLGVLMGHVLAVLPYTILTLGPSYQHFDQRYTQVAATLGKTWWSQRWAIKWSMLKGPMWRSSAIAASVSVAQYLPTEWLGGGRIATLTTEALSQSSGGERALSAAWAAAQWVLPLAIFYWAQYQSQSDSQRLTGRQHP